MSNDHLMFGTDDQRAAFERRAADRSDIETTDDALTPVFITSPLLGAAIGFTYTVSTAVHC
jgi:hypothetical protein